MWSMILTFLKNPKNILIVIMSILIIILIVFGMWLKVSNSNKIEEIEKQKTLIESQKKDLETYKAIQDDLLKQMQEIRQTQIEQQKITQNTAKIMESIKNLKTKCVMEKEDAKSLGKLIDYFNTGMLSE